MLLGAWQEGQAGQAGMQAEPPSAPPPSLRLPILAGLKPQGSILCSEPHRCWHRSWSPQGGWALPKAGDKERGQIPWDGDVRPLQGEMLCQRLSLPCAASPSCALGCPGEWGPAQASSQLRQTHSPVLALPQGSTAMPSCLLQWVSTLPCGCPPKASAAPQRPGAHSSSCGLQAAGAGLCCRQQKGRGRQGGGGRAPAHAPRGDLHSPPVWVCSAGHHLLRDTQCPRTCHLSLQCLSPGRARGEPDPRPGTRGHREGPHQKWWQCRKPSVPVCCWNFLHWEQGLPATASATATASVTATAASATASALWLNWVTHRL